MTSRTDDDRAWMAHAKCRGAHPNIMHPTDAHGVYVAINHYCNHCPVIGACHDYALDHKEEVGVWGGLSDRARARIWKQRRKEAA